MSVILITHHDENIYNVIKFMEDDKVPEQKGPEQKASAVRKTPHLKKRTMYKSKHSKINEFYKRCRKMHATMGVPEEEPPDPERFLKKHTGKPLQAHPCRAPVNEEDERLVKLKPKQAKVPTLEELRKEPREKRVSRNFIDRNIKKVTDMKAKEPEERVVLDRHGTSKPLKAGLEPMFIKLPQFGRRPKYLIKFITVRNKYLQMQKDETGTGQPKCRYITKEEREQLLNGLKQNWEELQKQYQGLPILTDTIPKINRKVRIENDLKQIEKDIVMVERHPYIYVYDENDLSKNC